MKLERVNLLNIRQFVGQQSIRFSTDGQTKVTLIHGPNTAGKTTLLNAVHWCLYGDFLSGFKEPERLKSEQSEGEGYCVEIQFTHHGKRYVVRRAGDAQPKAAKLTVLEERNNGQSIPHPQPDLLIGSILPKALAKYFLFAGEMIQSEEQSDSTEAIRSVLGLKLAEQAIGDLKEVRKKKQKELLSMSEGTDLARVTSDLGEAQNAVDLYSGQLVQQRHLVVQLETHKRELYDKLRDVESSTKLQQRRDANNAALKRARDAEKEALNLRQELISEYGPSLFLSACATQAISYIEEGVTRKKIPSPFDKTFVQDILKSRVCICERAVTPGSPEYRAVSSLVNDATSENTIRRVLSVRGIAGVIENNVRSAPRSFSRALSQIKQAQEEIARLEQEEARVTDLLKRHEDQNVRHHEAQLDNVERKLREMVANRNDSEKIIEDKKRAIAALTVERDRAQAISPQVEQVRRALVVIDKLIETLETELKAVEATGIASISAALNHVVNNSTRAKYSADITREYEIKLSKLDTSNVKRPVYVLSSGERRLLDLCFVSALVSVCRDRESDKDALVLPGAVAPLMVDAPFGELDPEYQALAVTTMKDLSDQLILMLSKTHWTEAVDKAIRPYLGSEYLLVGYRTGPARDAMAVETTVAGKTYHQMHYDADRDWTKIEAVGVML
jgi:DNA sulfur modification protein DndD